MVTERLPMRQIREILRLKWTLQRSHRETARSVGVSTGGVASAVKGAAGGFRHHRTDHSSNRPAVELGGLS